MPSNTFTYITIGQFQVWSLEWWTFALVHVVWWFVCNNASTRLHHRWLFAGPQRSRVAAQELKAAGFLDKQSKRVSVKFGSMHSESSLFSFVRIDLTMSSAGIFSENSVDIQSVRLEPYILGSNAGDRVLLACEVRHRRKHGLLVY